MTEEIFLTKFQKQNLRHDSNSETKIYTKNLLLIHPTFSSEESKLSLIPERLLLERVSLTAWTFWRFDI